VFTFTMLVSVSMSFNLKLTPGCSCENRVMRAVICGLAPFAPDAT